MGFAIVHMMKIGKSGIRGIQSHNQREKESRTNPDIDKTRTKYNYNLTGEKNINYNMEIQSRIKKYAINTKTVRKDAVVLCNFLITSDENTMKSMTWEQQQNFFKDSTNFFAERYGTQNIISATVHMDETTPHMHLSLVPITTDGRLSAKSLFNKTELQNLQTDFARNVGETYSLQRGIAGSERTHLSEQQFKIKTALKKEKEALDKLSSLQNEFHQVSYSVNALKAEYEALKAFIDQSAKDSELSVMYPAYVHVEERGFFKKEKYVTIPAEKWEEKHISANQLQTILQSREALEKSIKDIKTDKSIQEKKHLTKQIMQLEKENQLLKKDFNTAMHDIKQIKDFLERHTNIAETFFKERTNNIISTDIVIHAVNNSEL